LPIASVAGPAALIAVLVVNATWPMTSWRYPEWVKTSAAVHEQLALAGPLAAGVASYYAAKLSGRRSLLSLGSSSRVGLASVLRHSLMLASWMTVAYATALAPVVIITAHGATAGGPDLLAIASGLLGMVSVVILGYTLGLVVPSTLFAPVAAAVAFLFLQLPNYYSSSWAGVIPLQGVEPTLGRLENPPVVAYRLLFLATLTVVLVVGGARFLRARRTRGPASRVGAFTGLVLPVVLAVVPLVRTPALFAFEQDPPAVCQEEHGVQVCAHRGHADDLPELRRITANLVSAYGARPDHLAVVSDDALIYTGMHGGGDTVWTYINPAVPLEQGVPRDIAYQLTGWFACQDKVGPSGALTGLDAARAEYSDRLTEWLLAQAGYPGSGRTVGSDTPGGGVIEVSADAFDSVDPAEVRGWLARQSNALATCALPKSELR
jgi:hypothetical protein